MLFPKEKIWKTAYFVFESNYYQNVNTFFWIFNQKFIILYLLLLWFFSCRDWWKNALLVPIGMVCYQIIMLLNDEIILKDELRDSLFVLPLVIIICGSLFVIRKKLSFYAQALDLKTQIDYQINKIEQEIKNG